jgi:hypothetical protein
VRPALEIYFRNWLVIMALARIFSRSPEQTTALSQQLQQHGYKVEVLSPDEAPTTLADLEIQLEACDPADVLRRAAELAARLQCDIAVAPGALQAETALEQAAAAPSLPGEQVASVVVADQAASQAAAPLSALMETHPVLQATDETELGSRGAPAQAGRWLGAAVATGVAAADKLLASCGSQFRESLELARIGLAKAQAVREQRLLDLTRRRAEAQQHALELKAGRNVVNAYLLRLQQAALEPVPDAQPLSSQPATPLVKPSVLSWKDVLSWKEKTKRIRLRKWEAVVAATALAGGLLGIGLSVAFHSRPTLSANRGATLPPAAVTPQKPEPKPASLPRPSPAVRKVTPKPAVQARRMPPKTPPQRNQDLVARDVTVRRVPPPKPTPRAQADGWKHFSDLSN